MRRLLRLIRGALAAASPAGVVCLAIAMGASQGCSTGVGKPAAAPTPDPVVALRQLVAERLGVAADAPPPRCTVQPVIVRTILPDLEDSVDLQEMPLLRWGGVALTFDGERLTTPEPLAEGQAVDARTMPLRWGLPRACDKDYCGLTEGQCRAFVRWLLGEPVADRSALAAICAAECKRGWRDAGSGWATPRAFAAWHRRLLDVAEALGGGSALDLPLARRHSESLASLAQRAAAGERSAQIVLELWRVPARAQRREFALALRNERREDLGLLLAFWDSELPCARRSYSIGGSYVGQANLGCVVQEAAEDLLGLPRSRVGKQALQEFLSRPR